MRKFANDESCGHNTSICFGDLHIDSYLFPILFSCDSVWCVLVGFSAQKHTEGKWYHIEGKWYHTEGKWYLKMNIIVQRNHFASSLIGTISLICHIFHALKCEMNVLPVWWNNYYWHPPKDQYLSTFPQSVDLWRQPCVQSFIYFYSCFVQYDGT